jgi:hypothetical protein
MQQEQSERVLVSIRVRPLNARELSQSSALAWRVDSGNALVRLDSEGRSLQAGTATFDRVFEPDATSQEVYDASAKQIVQSVIEGVNGTVFAYGQTSSGKTFTMQAITVFAVADIFDAIARRTAEREFSLLVSYTEIYNEVIKDLLDPTKENLQLRESHTGVYVEGISQRAVRSARELHELVAQGEANRHVGATGMNEKSSRSHTILRLEVRSQPKAAARPASRAGSRSRGGSGRGGRGRGRSNSSGSGVGGRKSAGDLQRLSSGSASSDRKSGAMIDETPGDESEEKGAAVSSAPGFGQGIVTSSAAAEEETGQACAAEHVEEDSREQEEGDDAGNNDDDSGEGEDEDAEGVSRPQALVAALQLVDLAGSERAAYTKAQGARLKEGGHINKSLLTLATVISRLSKGQVGHIPYRDSKLTRMLQPALGGNSRTSIICCVTPAAMHAEETQSTVGFASRAKSIKNTVQVNEIVDDRTLIARLRQEIERLRRRPRDAESVSEPPMDPAAKRRRQSSADAAAVLAVMEANVGTRAHGRGIKRSQSLLPSSGAALAVCATLSRPALDLPQLEECEAVAEEEKEKEEADADTMTAAASEAKVASEAASGPGAARVDTAAQTDQDETALQAARAEARRMAGSMVDLVLRLRADRAALVEQQNRCEALIGRATAAEARAGEVQRACDASDAKVASARADAEAARADVAEAQAEAASLRVRLAAAENQVVELAARNAALSDNGDIVFREGDDVESERTAELRQLTERLGALQQRYDEVCVVVQRDEAERARTALRVSELEAARDAALAAAASEALRAEAAGEEARQAALAAEAAAAHSRAVFEAEKAAAEAQWANRLCEHEAELATLRLRLDARKAAEESANELRASNGLLLERVAQGEAEVARLSGMLRERDEAMMGAEAARRAAENEANELRARLASTQEDFAAATVRMERAEAEWTARERRLLDAASASEALEARNRELAQLLSAAQQKCAALSKEKDEHARSVQQMVHSARANAAHTHRLQELVGELEAKLLQLQTRDAESSAEVTRLQRLNEERLAELEEKEATIRDLEKRVPSEKMLMKLVENARKYHAKKTTEAPAPAPDSAPAPVPVISSSSSRPRLFGLGAKENGQ